MVRPTTPHLGAYRLLERISVGGMAEVYRAQRADGSGPEVALKRILPHLARDAEFVQMFIDEARTAAQLHHPNICRVFEFGEDQGTHFLTMELIEGRDLKRVMEYYRLRGRPLPLPIALQIMGRTCDALDHAHRALDAAGRPLRIVHRDVTPQNILISFLGEVKLIDFGIAKAAHRMAQTQAGNIKGKLSYLAPEQLDGHPATQRSDLFACGIVLHELLTNSRLFAGDNDLITIDLVRRAVAPPPSRLAPSLPRALDAVVLRALARNPEARHASVGELRDAIDAIAAESGNTGSTSQVLRWMNEVFAHDRVRAERARDRLPPSGSLLFPPAARGSGLRTLVDGLASELTPSPESFATKERDTLPEEPPSRPTWLEAATTIEPPRHLPEPLDFDADDSKEVTMPRAVPSFPLATEPARTPRSDQTGPPTPAMAAALPPPRPALAEPPSITQPDGLPTPSAVDRGGGDPGAARRRGRATIVALAIAILLLAAGGVVLALLLLGPTKPATGSAGSRALEARVAPVAHALADAAGPSPERSADLRQVADRSVADRVVPPRTVPVRASPPRTAPPRTSATSPGPRPTRRTIDAGATAAPTPRSSARPAEVGFLIIASKPWSRVWIDGSDTGRSTPIPPGAPLRLSAGPHRVTLQVEERSFDYSVKIDAGMTARLVVTLPVTR
jgi:serine/threonine protein kinase